MTNNCCQEQGEENLEGNSLNMSSSGSGAAKGTEETTSTSTSTLVSQPVVTVSQGQLNGTILHSRSGRSYSGFLGVPYAKEPKRFELASPPENWEGVRDATEYGTRCIQKDSISKQVWGSEDCLFLNVFSPQTSFDSVPDNLQSFPAPFPVIVFIHGGAFLMGAGDEYDAKYLLDKDIVVVTLNYRLGIFGFLSTEDGLVEENLGLKDQVLALTWIQENISHFGGDPSRVTLAGQSAGSACVHYHILSSASRGLFSAAIMQSGTALSPWGYQAHPLVFVKALAEQLGGPVNDSKEMIDFFKSLDARVLAAGDYNYEEWKAKVPIIFSPSKEVPKDGKTTFLPDSPWNIISSNLSQINQVPILMGMTSHEGLNRAGPVLHSQSLLKRFNENWNMMAPLNLMYRTAAVDKDDISEKIKNFYFETAPIATETSDRLISLFSDRYFFSDIFKTASLHATQNDHVTQPVFMYMFGYQGDNSMLNLNGIHQIMGVTHSDDLQYIFDTTLFPLGLKPGTKSVEMSEQMVELWAHFISYRNMSSLPLPSEKFKPWLPLQMESESTTETSGSAPRPLQYYLIDVGGEMVEQSADLVQRLEFWDETLPAGQSH